MGDIMNTLDDILGAETMLWNAILLSNIITAFTTHLSNFKQCHNASHSLGSTTLSLNNNYIRIKCHIETILDVLKANIISLCSSVPVYGVRRSSLLESPAYKRNTTAIAVGNNTPVCPQGLKRSTRMRNIGDMNNMCVDTTKKTLILTPIRWKRNSRLSSACECLSFRRNRNNRVSRAVPISETVVSALRLATV